MRSASVDGYKRQQLSGANDLLRAELALQEKQLHIQEKNRLYDQVAKEIAPQLFQIDQLLKEKEEGKSQKTLARICVIGAYVKRRSNLLLLSENTAYLPAKAVSYTHLCPRLPCCWILHFPKRSRLFLLHPSFS